MTLTQLVSVLKGERGVQHIKCRCGGEWIAWGNKKIDARERRAFIEKHGSHTVREYAITTKLTTVWQY